MLWPHTKTPIPINEGNNLLLKCEIHSLLKHKVFNANQHLKYKLLLYL
jgi:hypothetical protein